MRLRAVTPDDVEDDALLDRLGRWRADHMAAYPTQFAVTRAGTRAWLRDVVVGGPGRLMLLVVDGDGEVVGHLGFDRADVGDGGLQLSNLMVGEPERMGPGAMRACLAGMLRWAQEALRPTRIWSPVFTDNVRSLRLMRSVGFVDRERTPMRLHVAGDRREYRPCAPGDDAPPDRWQLWLDLPLTPAPPFRGVGLGTAPTARGDASAAGRARLAATVERARERGVRWLDTAGIYGLGAVEETLGSVLGDAADRPAVATKCGLAWDARADRAVAVGDARTLREQADASRARLGQERLDLLLLHRPPADDGALEAAWTTLAELAAAGVAARIGLAGGGAAALARCHALRPVDAFQTAVSPLRTDAAAVAAAHARGVPVLAHGVLETGLLAGADDAAPPHPRDRRRRSPLFADPDGRGRLLAALQAVAREIPCTVAELAVARTLGVPGVAGAAVGASRPEQVAGWSSAAGVRLEPAHRAALDAALAAFAGSPA
nr:aldo/keto reductase [Patulibacter sp. SYSU D01012]